MPLAETQMATVLSNADPQGKGRVRVRMELADGWYANRLGACDDTLMVVAVVTLRATAVLYLSQR